MDVGVVVAVLLDAAQRVELGQDAAVSPSRPCSASAATTPSRGEDPLQLGEDPLLRDAARARGRARARQRASRGVGRRARARAASRTSRSDAQRVVGERAPGRRRAGGRAREVARRRRAGRRSSPPASGSAIALTVKSRSARSASSEPPRSGLTSTCQERSRAMTRQAPNASDSSNAGPRAARARARARPPRGRRPRRRGRGRSVGRPSSASRTAPPTSHARAPAGARARRATRRRGGRLIGAARRRGDRRAARAAEPAGDLVVDRPEAPRDLLGADALAALRADQDGLVADRRGRRRADVDRDVVHADGADERARARRRSSTSALFVSARRTAVAVADRHVASVRRRARRRSAGRSRRSAPAAIGLTAAT